MPSLYERQRALARAIFDDKDAVAADMQFQRSHVPANSRLAVYQGNVVGNLCDALASVYPTVRALVGTEFFDHAAERFIRETPSRSGNLNDYGMGFAQFLAQFPPAGPVIYLADIARLDWLCHEALLAEDSQDFDFNGLCEITPDDYTRIRFQLHPAVRLLRSPYPLFRIWRLCVEAYRPESDGASDTASGDAVNLNEGADCILVSRPGIEVQVASIAPAQFALLSALRRGEPFAAACEAALEVDAAAPVDRWLQQHVAAGTLAGWSL